MPTRQFPAILHHLTTDQPLSPYLPQPPATTKYHTHDERRRPESPGLETGVILVKQGRDQPGRDKLSHEQGGSKGEHNQRVTDLQTPIGLLNPPPPNASLTHPSRMYPHDDAIPLVFEFLALLSLSFFLSLLSLLSLYPPFFLSLQPRGCMRLSLSLSQLLSWPLSLSILSKNLPLRPGRKRREKSLVRENLFHV